MPRPASTSLTFRLPVDLHAAFLAAAAATDRPAAQILRDAVRAYVSEHAQGALPLAGPAPRGQRKRQGEAKRSPSAGGE